MKSQRGRSMVAFLKTALDAVWFLGLISVGLFVLLFLWSLVAEPTAVSAFALEVGFGGFNFERPREDGNLTMVLPVALEMASGTESAELKNIHADLRFPVQKGWFFSFSLLLVLALFTIGAWTVAQLRQVFGTLLDGEPFAAGNAARIQRVGIGVILAELVHTGAVLYWSYSAGDLATANGARFVPATHFGAPAILYGLVILVIAEIFREGERLREEQSLTI